MADNWIAPFRMNQVCFDRQVKEFVRISNGKCTLDHSNSAAYAEAHKGGECLYAPSEAIALRCVGVNSKGDPIVAFTYRRVDAEESAMPDVSKIRRSRFIGRV